ncbi:quinone oxidoreductase [Magnetospira sp. QH-2]|uniref:quinone oxidoreductase family protein n=1 Tax=Magnetospira sp. (strain QH-2) TaxID=1288970 RepID=UPI0003E80F48|nr:quinone oxidoreductase [Magnetospira sp. QH-2]CCQ75616.1 Quinone oxidoreductase (NADPH:quinone reductase) [Magnetospira sp. QH-2]
MTKAIRIHQTGGPEAMTWEDVTVGDPGPGQVRVKNTAVGVNFIDVYHRTGLYPVELPSVLGMEGAGVVEAIGTDVTDLNIGQRVAYNGHPVGAYAEARLYPADRLVPLPDAVSDQQAAAMMLKGMTAHYLLRRSYEVQAGDTILIHAAAGGVGQIAVQWAKHLGATVIGTVGSDEKAEIARSRGCDHTILYKSENFADRVKDITGGEGVQAVYDSIGKDTFEDSLNCLHRLGTMVSYGNASGPVPAFEPALLAQKGSLFFTRPILFHYITTREELLATAEELFEVVTADVVDIAIGQTFPLSDAAEAHRALEARQTTGSTILLP